MTQAAEATLPILLRLCKPHLILHQARLTCFLMLVLAVIKQRTVSLVWLSQNTESDAKQSSVHRRFQRFFAQCDLPPKTIGKLILALAPRPEKGWILAMDRTNWKFGKTHVNLLVVTLIVYGVGYPIAWRVLPKKTKRGNSRKAHRISLMKEVLELLPAEKIYVLTMDREFVGKNWLNWLSNQNVPYIVRVKKNARIGERSAAWLSERNRWKKHTHDVHKVFEQEVYFSAKRIKKGRAKYLSLISDRYHGEEALELYRMRWGIETLFGHLKKRGYQFEETHLTKPERVEKLFGVISVAFTLSHRWGQELEKESDPVKLKKHGYRTKSVFRKGFESLHRMFWNPDRYVKELANFFEIVIRQSFSQSFVM